jgi:hypothetical protein
LYSRWISDWLIWDNIRWIDSIVRNNILQIPYIMINNQITSIFIVYTCNISLMIAEAPWPSRRHKSKHARRFFSLSGISIFLQRYPHTSLDDVLLDNNRIWWVERNRRAFWNALGSIEHFRGIVWYNLNLGEFWNQIKYFLNLLFD